MPENRPVPAFVLLDGPTIVAITQGRLAMEHSLFAAQMWDLRSSLERQLRCLTTVQQAHGEFRREKDPDKRFAIKSSIVRDLHDIHELTVAVQQTLEDAVKQADEEFRP